MPAVGSNSRVRLWSQKVSTTTRRMTTRTSSNEIPRPNSNKMEIFKLPTPLNRPMTKVLTVS